ncbi:MAG: hypothetical protein EAZ55_07790 [Cytophagales bacterium]|nr:MAG: hypothetical protein EAZ55_07790 [Cytophagales bacterium]
MLEFLYTFFLLRFGVNALKYALRKPTQMATLFKVCAYILIGLTLLIVYTFFSDKENFETIQLTNTFIGIGAIVVLVVPMLWAAFILDKASQEQFDLPIFKGLQVIARGYVGLALVSIMVASVNLFFAVILLLGVLLWLFMILATLGLVFLKDDFKFETFTYLPMLFFKAEQQLFNFLGIEPIAFIVIIVSLVVFLPFLMALWVLIFQQKLKKVTS